MSSSDTVLKLRVILESLINYFGNNQYLQVSQFLVESVSFAFCKIKNKFKSMQYFLKDIIEF